MSNPLDCDIQEDVRIVENMRLMEEVDKLRLINQSLNFAASELEYASKGLSPKQSITYPTLRSATVKNNLPLSTPFNAQYFVKAADSLGADDVNELTGCCFTNLSDAGTSR